MSPRLAKLIVIKVAKLDLKCGDRLLFKLPNYVTPEQSTQFREQVQSLFPEIPVVVLPDAIDVLIVPRPADLP